MDVTILGGAEVDRWYVHDTSKLYGIKFNAVPQYNSERENIREAKVEPEGISHCRF
jgi:hypothetical protein